MLIGPVTFPPLMVVFGYLWPAYQTFKALSLNSHEQLRDWCIYWLVLAAYLAVEWVADTFIFWLPLYHEAKLLLILYMWNSRTKGAVAIYEKLLLPLLRANEARIDQMIEETKARVADMVSSNVNRARNYTTSNASTLLASLRNFSEQQPKQLHGNPQQQAAAAAAAANPAAAAVAAAAAAAGVGAQQGAQRKPHHNSFTEAIARHLHRE